MKIFKKLSPFILLLIIGVITFRFLFFISYIHVQKADLREKLINSSTKELVEVKFLVDDIYIDKNGFEWKEKNKELVINGEYHEVISVTKVNDHFIVKIIADKAENQLFQNFFSTNKDLQHNYLDLVKILLTFNYLNDAKETILLPVCHKLNYEHIPGYAFSGIQFHLKQIKPPQLA